MQLQVATARVHDMSPINQVMTHHTKYYLVSPDGEWHEYHHAAVGRVPGVKNYEIIYAVDAQEHTSVEVHALLKK